MFNHSFDTTAGSVHLPHSLPGRLLVSNAEEALVNPLFPKLPFLAGVVEKNARTNTIPAFTHPFTLSRADGDITFIDLRFYSSQLRRTPEGGVAFPTEGALGILVRRTLLEVHWNVMGPRHLMYASDAPLVIFARWIKGLLAKKLNLNEETALKVEVLTAYYYLSLHIKEEELTERMVEVFAVKINRNFRIPFQKIMDWLQPVGYLGNLEDFAMALVNWGGSISLAGVSKSTLWTLVSTSWFGSSDVKDLLFVSLEFPPAFVSLVYAGCTEKTYRKAFLTNVIEREGKQLKTPQFISQIDGLIQELIVSPVGQPVNPR